MPNFSVPNQINPGDTSDATKAMANWNQVVNDLNAAKVDNTNIAASAGILADQLTDSAKLGISGASTVRRGKVNTATGESTASTSYTLLTTPDKVASVVLPTDGLIVVAFQALWQNTVASNGRAAIFIGANQLKQAGNGAPAVQEASGPSSTNQDNALNTFGNGLVSYSGGVGGTEVTTGQVVGNALTAANGGAAYIFAAAGTYDVSVQFKNAAAGTLTVKNRHLWCWTIGF